MYSKREIKNNTPKKNSEKNSPKKDFKFDWNFLNRYINIIESEFFTSKMFQKYMLQEIDISIKKFGISFSELFPILMKNNFDFNLVKKFLSNYKCKNLLIEKKEILCEICGLLSNKNFMMDCGHSYCQDCIKDYIKYNLQNFGSDAINRTCPTQGCEVKKY